MLTSLSAPNRAVDSRGTHELLPTEAVAAITDLDVEQCSKRGPAMRIGGVRALILTCACCLLCEAITCITATSLFLLQAAPLLTPLDRGSLGKAPTPGEWFISMIKRRRSFGADGFVFDPIAFGADPTGQRDSTAALQATLDAAAAISVPGSFIGNSTNHGGATVDLRGGEYRVHSALRVGGKRGGGLRLCCGAIRASSDFPASGFLVNIVGLVEDTTLEDLQLDCAQTGGGIRAFNSLRVRVTRLYIHGFTTAGLKAIRGHELHLSDSFLGQFWWNEDMSTPGSGSPTGTGVIVDGQDHLIDSVVVFSAAVGIEVNGGAAIISTTHIYNGGGASLIVRGQEVRIIGCYFDFEPVVLIDPVAVVLSHCYFLGAVGIELRSSGSPDAFVSGLQVTHNQFVVGSANPHDRRGVWVNETAGKWSHVNQTLVSDNMYPPATYGDFKGLSILRSATRISRTRVVREPNTSSIVFHLRDELLFDCDRIGIASAEHTVLLPMGANVSFLRTAARLSGPCSVRIYSDMPLPRGARVSVSVDQMMEVD